MTKVIALYDFSAQPNTGEISIIKDEIITVTRQDIGEGWWEGINSEGKKGLFPAEYVVPVETTPLPPSQPPISNDSWNSNSEINTEKPTVPIHQSSNQPKPALLSFSNPIPTNKNNNNFGQSSSLDQFEGDWGDDDWDDDDSQASEITTGDYSSTTPPQNIYANRANSGKPSQPTIKKSINRFSHFVKSGGEDYILGLKTYNVNQNDYIHIILDNGILKWSPSYFTVTVSVENPKKESKMKGLKSYIAYQLTPSDTENPVSRRYKHFDWLHERLQNKFTTIPIPSLPDKQISGRYQDDFIQNRRIQLQSWVNRICRHPVLSQSTVWKHFITCKDEKQWKTGKRRAEKDELVGGFFFLTVQTPEEAFIDSNADLKLEQFSRFITKLDESSKTIYAVSQEMIKRYQSFYKREFSKVGSIFSNLSEAFMTSPSSKRPEDKDLIEAIDFASETYESIGKLFEFQHWHDFGPLSNLMHEYRGILTAWPEIFQVYRGAASKKKEHKKALDENRLDENSLTKIEKRADVVTFATLAEMNHFQVERVNDFGDVMKIFLTGQLHLYQSIVSKLEAALSKFPQ